MPQKKSLTAVGTLMALFLFALLRPQPALATNSPAKLCDEAARIASAETGVPLNIMKAISRTETGRQVSGVLQPWPWAFNIEGRGVWLSTKQEAMTYLRNNLLRGKQNLDVGCYQINQKWHGSHFSSIDEMLDPVANALYAARFLERLFQEHGNWTVAAGAYHSRTPQFALRYIERFGDILASLDAGPATATGQRPGNIRGNGFPLLIATEVSSTRGSLFPSSARSRGSLLIRPRGSN